MKMKKRWEDNIKEGTEIKFASSTRAVEDRARWQRLLSHLWCPSDLVRLWDRME